MTLGEIPNLHGISPSLIIPFELGDPKMRCTYTCDNCRSTKTIRMSEHQKEAEFLQELPDELICGVRGCQGTSYPAGTKKKVNN